MGACEDPEEAMRDSVRALMGAIRVWEGFEGLCGGYDRLCGYCEWVLETEKICGVREDE